MEMTRDFMLERFLARDADWDGRFLTGVVTTGIYCIASCPARKPKPENVRFFGTEEEARAAGLRPCRRCRPDRYLRDPDHDPGLRTVEALAERVRRDPAAFPNVTAMADVAGVGATTLHALAREHLHETPAAFLIRARVDAALPLLVDGAGPAEAAFAVGYDSVSAFHEAFRRRTGVTPGAWRRLGERPEFVLALPDDYLAEYTLARVGRDPESRTERVDGSSLAKGVRLAGGPAVLRIDFHDESAHVRVDAPRTLSPDEVREAHGVAVRLLGLAADPASFERRLEATDGLARLVEGRRGLRVPLDADPFESLTWAVVGQQVNLAFAYALRRDLAELAGQEAGDGLLAHPSPEAIAALDEDELTRLRFSRRKAEYLIGIARDVVSGELPLDDLLRAPATRVERALLAVRGIGPWSAHYAMMRGWGFADCVPVGDSGLVEALRRFWDLDERPDAGETRRRMEPFAPYRTLATHHLWSTLAGGAA